MPSRHTLAQSHKPIFPNRYTGLSSPRELWLGSVHGKEGKHGKMRRKSNEALGIPELDDG